jgi:hypothetical protein
VPHRLSRDLAFIAALMDSGVEFVAVDNGTVQGPNQAIDVPAPHLDQVSR